MAGGTLSSSTSGTTEDLADLSHSFLVRQGQMLPVNFDRLLRQGDLAQNVYLQPDDFVYLPSSLSRDIYVLGAVRAPKVVGYLNQGTLPPEGRSGARTYPMWRWCGVPWLSRKWPS